MKAFKGIVLFGIVCLAASSCFDPPEFPVVPEIDLDGIYFGVSPTGTDSIVLSIAFKDGDGDLGLSTEEISFPYHPRNYFLARNGGLTPVPTKSPYTDIPPILYLNEGQQGKLATVELLSDPQYADDMLPFVYPYTCNTYIFDSLYVEEGDEAVFDASYNITDTLYSSQFPDLYEIKEIWYTEKNPNYNNIRVDFEIKNANGSYSILDWETITGTECGTNFHGRFPVLSEKNGPLDGVLHYSMKSEGFLFILSSRTFRLRIQIKDRALNSSNEIITADYTLDKLRR